MGAQDIFVSLYKEKGAQMGRLICDWAGKEFDHFQLESSILGLVGNFMCCVRVAVKYLVNLYLVCTC